MLKYTIPTIQNLTKGKVNLFYRAVSVYAGYLSRFFIIIRPVR
jgi:hypothetical protein